jgi:4-hydroxybenzoate polyprenyltransferase
MQALLSLIRFPNLVIVAVTQGLLYYRVLLPPLKAAGIERTLDNHAFTVFVLITMLITAGGYIINDLLDQSIDVINKPQKTIVDREIDASTAYWLYFSLNLLGYIMALYLAFIIGYIPWLFIYPAAVAGLYFYSHALKRMPLWGNLLVAFYCAAVAAILLLAERESFQLLFDQSPAAARRISALFLWYIAFAFLSTLYRELIKDLEDEPGDRRQGLRTAPIAWGQKRAKFIALSIGLILLLFIAIWLIAFFTDFPAALWLFLGAGVTLPLLYTLFQLRKACSSSQFHQLSQVTKWIMLAGILLLLFF